MKAGTLSLPLIGGMCFLTAQESETCDMQCYELTYPSCRFDTCCSWNFFVTAEGLWWIAKENGLIYAQNGAAGPGPQTADVPPTSFNFKGKLERIDPNWDWGFRLGLGYNFCYDEWEAKATWTYYKTDKSDQKEGSLLNLWGHTDVSSSSTSNLIKADFELHYNTFDLEFGRGFGAGRCFCLRPYFGIRGAFIDQKLDVFNQALLLNPNPGETLSTDLKAISDFSGGGFRFGLDGRFDFCWDMSLFGIASYSLLYGKFHADFRETTSGTPEDGSNMTAVSNLVIADTDDEFHMGVSSIQLSLGLQWNRSYCCDQYRFGLHIAWEQNLWFQLNQMNHFQSRLEEGILLQEHGNLSLQGISFGARFDF
ncbi:MAG: hypothetical protein K1000chlam3_01180 [Chlamydiae bacterium]|nr:hypothetical protein [Chlamydiota bacterium]